jgi:hypothetical protein
MPWLPWDGKGLHSCYRGLRCMPEDGHRAGLDGAYLPPTPYHDTVAGGAGGRDGNGVVRGREVNVQLTSFFFGLGILLVFWL